METHVLGLRCKQYEHCKMSFESEEDRSAHESTYNHYKCIPCDTGRLQIKNIPSIFTVLSHILAFFHLDQLERHRLEETCKDLVCPLCGFGADIPIEIRYSKVRFHKRTKCMSKKVPVRVQRKTKTFIIV